jgi:enoyl-[acyl-carrier-protein] reductase (NADH)
MKKKIPLGRFLVPEDIAAMAIFLGSDVSSMITGTNIVIDGGFSIN